MCFEHCVDNFFTRNLSTVESNCLDRCVAKFSSVNQRVMGSYLVEQATINERRMKEIDAQMQMQQQVQTADEQTQPAQPIESVEATNVVT